MMVAHVSPWGIPCGIGRHLLYLAREITRPQVILCDEPPYFYTELGPPDYSGTPCDYVPNVWMRMPSRWYRKSLIRLWEELCNRPVSVMHVQFDPSFFDPGELANLLRSCRVRGIGTVATVHIIQDDAVYREAYEALFLGVDCVVVQTELMREAVGQYCVERNLPPPRSVQVIPLPVPEPPALSGEPDGSRFVSFGILGTHKGHQQVAAALRHLTDRYPDVTYTIHGSALTGEQRNNSESLRKISRATGGRVRVIEGWPDEAELYRICQSATGVVLNCQLFANRSASGTVNLAVASGRPVVTSNSTMFAGVEDAVIQASDQNGGLTGALCSVLSDRDLVQSKLDAARRITEDLIAPAVAARYELVYQEVERARRRDAYAVWDMPQGD